VPPKLPTLPVLPLIAMMSAENMYPLSLAMNISGVRPPAAVIVNSTGPGFALLAPGPHPGQ